MSEQQIISSLVQDYMNAILDNFDEGIYITDSEANTVYLNHSYELISGLKKSQMLGENMNDLVESGVVSLSGTLLVLESKKKVTIEQSFHTGKRAVITSMPIFDNQGDQDHIIMVVTVVRETTELYSVRRELKRQEQLAGALRNELDQLRREMDGEADLIAADEKTRQVLHLAGRVALTDSPVLLTGEDGSGKSEIARYIHRHSGRSDSPFMRVDFSAISGVNVSSYLFGGLDTGSGVYQMGIVESAGGGTIYIEEIMDVPKEVFGQILALLRYDSCVLGDGILHRLNIRIIAGSSMTPEEMRENKEGCEEILSELSRFVIEVPALSERPDDIIPLADYFLRHYNRSAGGHVRISRDAYREMVTYAWPQNVTELRNTIQRAAIVCADDCIEPEDLNIKPQMQPADGTVVPELSGADLVLPVDMKAELARIEAAYMSRAFLEFGNVREAADSLGFDSSTFVRKRQKYQKMGLMEA